MFLNFMFMISSLCFAIWYGIKKYKGSCIAMAGCVLLNMPFAIKWLVLFITNQIE